jgi:predicted RNase H-like nuclease
MSSEASILGIDAAWTTGQPSGVAVVALEEDVWRCRVVAPSYESFRHACAGQPVDWANGSFDGGTPSPMSLIDCSARVCSGHKPTVVAVDMPLSQKPITGRRTADNLVSTEFGGRGCGTHTPSTTRPGRLSDDLRMAFGDEGYTLTTECSDSFSVPRQSLIEVYPHPALLSLLEAKKRVPYKVSKSGKYWKGSPIPVRIQNLLEQFALILETLGKEIHGIDLTLPSASSCRHLSGLKRYEDALDALICCWVGMRYANKRATPYGDTDAAIWIPAGGK